MRNAPPPEIKNEGQRQLLEVEGSESTLSAKIGCGSAVIGHWRRGRRVPGERHRHTLELLFGIPRRAWDVEPGAEVEIQKKAKSRKKRNSGGEEENTLEITKAQIDSILEELKSQALTDTAVAKLRDTLAKLLALRARLERDQELLEDRIVREHPAWVRLKAGILKALKPYPEAAKAVLEAIE